jgi:hypothetical protein
VQSAGGPWIQSAHGWGKPVPGQSLGAWNRWALRALHVSKPSRRGRIMLSKTMQPGCSFARRRRWLPLFCPCIVLPQPAPDLSAERWGAKRCHRKTESPVVSHNHGYKIMRGFPPAFFFRLFSPFFGPLP